MTRKMSVSVSFVRFAYVLSSLEILTRKCTWNLKPSGYPFWRFLNLRTVTVALLHRACSSERPHPDARLRKMANKFYPAGIPSPGPHYAFLSGAPETREWASRGVPPLPKIGQKLRLTSPKMDRLSLGTSSRQKKDIRPQTDWVRVALARERNIRAPPKLLRFDPLPIICPPHFCTRVLYPACVHVCMCRPSW